MALTLTEYLNETRRLVQDNSNRLAYPEDFLAALATSMRWYSGGYPRIVALDLTSDGTGVIPITSLTGYDVEFSDLVRVEYPITTQYVADTWPLTDYEIVPIPTGYELRHAWGIPATKVFRIAFTVVHSLSSTTNSLPDSALASVSQYAAAEVCDTLARFFAQSVESYPQADMAIFHTKGDEYSSRARALRASAVNLIRRIRVA